MTVEVLWRFCGGGPLEPGFCDPQDLACNGGNPLIFTGFAQKRRVARQAVRESPRPQAMGRKSGCWPTTWSAASPTNSPIDRLWNEPAFWGTRTFTGHRYVPEADPAPRMGNRDPHSLERAGKAPLTTPTQTRRLLARRTYVACQSPC
jgi:hypothetical protein